ncbi:MAG: hypothetical protein ABR502_10040 [Chitinophagaceae bacterium]
MQQGIFTISLDFELHWGVSETKTVESYRENLDNTRAAIDGMLSLFHQYGIHVTWAAVGMLFCKDKKDLLSWCQSIQQPSYVNSKLSNFTLALQVGEDEKKDPYHFANDVIPKVLSVHFQEIGTHTFSHYYCLERGQTINNFTSDLQAAIEIGIKNNIVKRSVVFPRNQYSSEHLQVCYQKGITTYRGTEKHWMYQPLSREKETKKRKAARLIDSYISISGQNTYKLTQHSGQEIYNVPSSRFLRPYNYRLRSLEKLRLKRIKNEMTFAAKQKRLYHLWWHPHNFGAHMQQNLSNLEDIIKHFTQLQNKYNFQSLNMGEVCDLFKVT